MVDEISLAQSRVIHHDVPLPSLAPRAKPRGPLHEHVHAQRAQDYVVTVEN